MAGPESVDYLGLPIDAAARAKGLSYSSTSLSLPERQCIYYPPHYLLMGPQQLKIWSENDPDTGTVVAWKIAPVSDRDGLTIWMDGRPHPSESAVHPISGFTTGVWEGNVLTTYTTHMKAGYLRRNGLPSSDRETMTLHFSVHGDILTISGVIEDPVYLTEPLVLSRSWVRDSTITLSTTSTPCVPSDELPDLKAGDVPHYLPGKNAFVDDMAKYHGIPTEAALGGAETMYPEYRKKLKDKYAPPAKCERYCCAWVTGRAANETTSLNCVGRPD